MMDPSEINNFEDQWRKALKEASEAPPQSVWEGIEARLDQQEDKGLILPIWWQSSKIWYAAASIAALLLVGGGIWYSNSGMKGSKVNHEIAASQNPKAGISAENESTKSSAEIESNADVSADVNKEQLALEESKAESASDAVRNNALRSDSKGATTASRNADAARRSDIKAGSTGNTPAQGPDNALAQVQKPAATAIENKINEDYAAAVTKESTVNDEAVAATESTMALALLPTTPYSDLDIHVQKRYVYFRPDAKIEEPVEPVKHTEYYAALSLMPASFNPNVKVKAAPVGFSGQSLSTRKAVTGSSEAGASYAVQTQGGMKLSKHWSVEMGVSYLKGNSTYEGGGYVMNAFSNKSANVLENAYAGLAPGYAGMNGDKAADFVNNGALYIDVAKTVSNNYHYLQLPVQAGFTIYPEKKFNASILGGMMANFFLSNELESASGEIITTKASDEIYRSMNWAATTGLRFNYRLSTRWNANLTGSYQKSVTSGFRSNQSLESRPYLYGISWGMRYSF
ncbi:PorT family protein [Dyadobacter chenwenxiniae]|uniref:PorT family protein n=1 Tax=Dyadobacter chenwenxiniae TaxID=2906456 RepID=A0A9X1PS55_9BACT|nr:outer membrane beta-barrel protein [Dyadobacter chenwenxiniae]MCF0065449.1 PorT family protein [Dyadobacter chenwenxiniae]UON82142.1 PorT family protein [Dyadobacter chenwenxiniae]